MKTFLIKISTFLTIQLMIATVLLWARPADPQGYFAAAIDKHHWAKAQQPPRLLLVGGSNLAFGVASDKLHAIMDYKTVNLALTAGLGLDYILNEARSLVRNRDVIVVSLEYEHFLKDHTSPTHVQLLLEARPESARHFSPLQIKTLLDEGLIYAHNQLRGTLHGEAHHHGASVYRRSAFNCYGDVIGHHHRQSSYDGYLKADPDQLQKVQRQQVDDAYLGSVVERLNLFARQCQRQGAQVYFTYPPLAADAYSVWQQHIAVIQQRLQQQLDCPILLQPADVVYPSSEFFDTCYHLNARSKTKRTLLLAESLRSNLQKRSTASGKKGHYLR